MKILYLGFSFVENCVLVILCLQSQ